MAGPHVTIAEGAPIDDPTTAVVADPAWATLPRSARVDSLEVIATEGARWRTVWRVRLTGHERR
jgi:hypothetical protein